MVLGKLTFFILLLSAAHCNAATTVVHLALKSDAVVSGRTVTLKDVAQINSVDPKIRQKLESILIARAPRIGLVDQLEQGAIDHIVKLHSPKNVSVNWSGSGKVQVRSRATIVDMEYLKNAVELDLSAQLQGRFQNIDIQVLQLPQELSVPHGVVNVSVRPLGLPLYERMPVWVDIKIDDVVYRSIVASVLLQSMNQVYVAKERMSAGMSISLSQFDREERNVIGIRQAIPAQVDEQVSVFKLKKPMNVGQVLTQDSMHPSGTIFYGDQVKLKHEDGGIFLEVRAIAEQQGVIGEVVKVRPNNAIESVLALVVAPGIVEAVGK